MLGIPGVGKSTIVQKLASSLSESNVVTFGSMMLEEGAKRRWVKNRDQLRKLPVEKQRLLQKFAATSISKMKEGAVIVDTHLFVRTKEGYWPGLPFDVARAMKPTHLVLIEASPVEIAKRRTSDKSRYRDPVSEKSLEEELVLSRTLLAVTSNITGAPMLVVTNSDGKSSHAAKEIVSALESSEK